MSEEYLSTTDVHGFESVDEDIALPDGTTGKIKVEKVGLDVIDKIERWEEEGKSESKITQHIFDEYVEEPPGLQISKMSSERSDAVLRGVFRAWGVSESDIDELIEEHEGN